MKRTALLLALAALLAAAACSQKTQGEAELQRPPVAVDVATVATGSFAADLEVVGVLTPKSEAEVKAEYPGTVTQILVTEWVPVKRGQVLARLDTREAEAARLQAKVAADRAQREYERALKLKEAGLMTSQGLEDAQTARDAAQAALSAVQARSDKGVIRAPIDGVVASRSTNVGDMATDKPLFRIVDNRLFDLTVTVPSSRIGSVAVGQSLNFTSDAVPGRTFEGKVAFINPSADPVSRAVKVVAEVPNADGALKSELFVRGVIATGSREAVLQVPRAAVLQWDLQAGTAELFVVEAGVARRRPVKTGMASGERVEVREGLAAGEKVVTRGAFNLKDGDRVSVQGS